MRCALIGVTGQLGHDLARTFDLPGELVRLTRSELDLLAPGAVGRVLREIRPTHVVNCAAYNLVDRAEDERDAAFAVNADAVGALAETCEGLGATLIHFSTDYVFDGAKRTPYTEDDAPAPLGVYAASKLAGERLALERCRRAFVIRVCGLYGVGQSATAGRTNFVETMLRLAASGKPLRVVELPMPGPVSFQGRRLPASYANFYIANGLVLVPTFNDKNDRLALNILAEVFSDREVVGIYCGDLIWGFGAIHCMTQQQPAA